MALRRSAALLGAALSILCLAYALHPSGGVAAASSAIERIDVGSSPIRNFKIGSDERRFGPMTFVGGLEMTSGARDFGSLSAFRFLKPGSDFIGVADTGFWFFGRDRSSSPAAPSRRQRSSHL